MSLKITHKYSTAAGTPPASGDIDVGEIAINAADAELYTKDNAGNIRKFQNTATGTADGVQFTQAGTGAVQRTVESKLQDVVSVKDFGAVGDGVADDTAAVQAAINYCSGKGVTLLFPGTYFCAGQVVLKSNIALAGGGALVAGPSSGFPAETHLGFLYGEDLTNVSIKDLKVDITAWTALPAGVQSLRCILLRRSSGIAISGNKLATTGGGPAFIGCTDATVDGNEVSCTTPSDSPFCHADGVIDCWVEFNVSAKRFVIASNRIKANGCGKWGIMVTGLIFGAQTMNAEGFTITGNNISNTYYDGIWAFGRDAILRNTSISGNVITSGRHGIRVSDAYGCSVTGNSVYNVSSFGIELFTEGLGAAVGVDSCVISSNSIHDAGQIGIYVTGQSDNNTITGNTVTGTTAQFSIAIPTGLKNTIAANRLAAAGNYIANPNYTDGSYTPTLTPVQNVASSTLDSARFYVTQGFVHVIAQLRITPTNITYTQIGISLPLAATGFSLYSVIGVANSTATDQSIQVVTDTTNNRATLAFSASDTSVRVVRVYFTYSLPL